MVGFSGEEFPVPLDQPLTNYEEKYLVEGRNRFKGSWKRNEAPLEIAREPSVEFQDGGRFTSARRPPAKGRSKRTRVDPGE